MKRSSDNDIEISIREVPTYERCCICQERVTTQTTVEETYIGAPPILVKDLLLQCFESPERYRQFISDEYSINYLCKFCEASLGEFYDAVLKVSLKRTEFLSRIQEKSVSPIEYFTIVETTRRDSRSSPKLVQNVGGNKIKRYHSQEKFATSDSSDEYSTLNISDEEFVKVNQPDEEFEDYWSSDSSSGAEVQDGEKEMQKPLITIERMPKTKLRFCWRCDKNFPSDDAFEIHLKQVHTKSKKPNLSCHKPQNSSAPEKHSLHISREEDSNQMRCEIREVEFDSTSRFQSHKDVHRALTCSICSKKMPTHRSFQRHMAVHRAEKRQPSPDARSFVCPVCDFKFRSAWNLKRHQKLHCLGDITRSPEENDL
ncbi:PR domain zinc finger protein 5-like [Anastrepha ludens]|uniref:PR domain zinc finger protein 5-like n=1 Tax=Anastrepha ludens TaxID=28586 RepID=UPI0023AF9A4F|nr:PR domain zinc finger protein 5-like [Anastrepha ludens]